MTWSEKAIQLQAPSLAIMCPDLTDGEQDEQIVPDKTETEPLE